MFSILRNIFSWHRHFILGWKFLNRGITIIDISFQQKKEKKKKETRKENCVTLWLGFHDLSNLIVTSCIFVNEPV